MHAADLHKRIGKEPLPPVLLFGPGKTGNKKDLSYEPLLADEAVKRIADHYVDPGMRDLVYAVFYADETPAGQIALEAQTLPFLAERRVIVVRSAERYDAMSGEKNSPLAPLLAYIEAPSETTLLLIVAARADKRKRLYKAIEAIGGIVECPALTPRELEAWARDTAAAMGKRLQADAGAELVRRAGERLGDVQNALRVVAGYIGTGDTIRIEDVIAACSDVAEESIWALTDAIASAHTAGAIKSLHQLIALGKSPDEIMGVINWMLESAYRVSPGAADPISSPFVAKKMAPLLQRLGVDKLKDAFRMCTRTHMMLRSTGVDRNLALELLVIKLAHGRRAAAARR